jgi:hypothetical protein
MQAGLKGLEIGTLVNNVGVSYPSALYFFEVRPTSSRLWYNIMLSYDLCTQHLTFS